jgi:diguanylate cyclase (GGDEF)-like protein
MRLNFPVPGTGVAVVAIAQIGVLAATLLALASFGVALVPLAVALVLALALLNAGLLLVWRRFKVLEESSRRLSLLAEMNVRVNREILLNEDIELIYRTILNYLFSVFNTASTGSVLILDDAGYLRFAASRGFSEAFVSKFHLKLEDCFLYQVTGGAIREARLITREDFEQIETVFKPGQWEYKSVISAPLFVGERLFGLLNLDSAVDGTYDAGDVEIVERFRTQIEVGLLARERYTTNIQRYQVDSLTGLLTRRYFEDLFKITLERAQRHQESFVIALFDVDGLKDVNDSFGHLAGDQLLLTIATVLRGTCRNSDIIGRLGGDEFVASYHLTELPTMEKNIAAIRARLRSKTMRVGDTEHRLSFSYGLARFPEDGTDQEALIAVADKRLYAMKSANK